MRKGKEASGFSCQNCILNVCDAECLSQTGAFIQMFSQKNSGPRLRSWDQDRTDTINGTSTAWVQQGADVIGNEVCNMIDYRASDGLLVVATHSKGIYSANISSLNDITTTKDIPAVSAYLNNYPNPFSNETTIAFTFQKPAYTTITIYDLLGRVVSQLSNNLWMNEGKHSFQLNAKQFSSGIYLCRLQANGIDETIRLVSNK